MTYHLIPRFNYDYNYRDFFYSFLKINDTHFDPGNLTKYFESGHIFFTNYARTGLRILLSTLGLKKNSRIGVQAFTCHTVFKAVEKAGHTAYFIDIGDDYTIDVRDLEKKVNHIDALIVTHTFGNPAGIDSIKKILKKKPLIEDCSHSLFSTYKNRLTGTFGDASIFSFGYGKYPSIGKGGFVIINKEELTENFLSEYNLLKNNKIKDEIKNVFKNYLWALAYRRPVYGLLTFPFGKKLDKKMDFTNKFDDKEAKGFKSNISLFVKNFESYIEANKRQRHNGKYVIERLGGFIKCVDDTPAKKNNFYIFPLRSNNRDMIVTHLLKNGIECGKHFSESLTWANRYGYREKMCVNTEKIIDEIFTIPCSYKLNKNYLDKIIKNLKTVI